MKIRHAILVSSMLVAVHPTSVFAQSTAAKDADGRIDEIVVTARRSEESAQTVPVAVTAFGAEQLEMLDIQGFGDIGKTVPNLDVQRQFGSASAPQYYLRGVSTGTLKFEADAGMCGDGRGDKAGIWPSRLCLQQCRHYRGHCAERRADSRNA